MNTRSISQQNENKSLALDKKLSFTDDESRNRFFFRPFNPFSRLNEEKSKEKKKRKKFIRIYTPVNNTRRDSSRGLCFSCDWITSVATWLHPDSPLSEQHTLSLSLSFPSWPCNVWNVRPTSLRRERSLAKLSVEKFATSSCDTATYRPPLEPFVWGNWKRVSIPSNSNRSTVSSWDGNLNFLDIGKLRIMRKRPFP